MVVPKTIGPCSVDVPRASGSMANADAAVVDTTAPPVPALVGEADAACHTLLHPSHQDLRHPLLTGDALSRNCHRVKVTLGTEYEWQQAAESEFSLFGTGLKGMILLAESNFRELFAFHGKADDGAWIQNLIPRRIAQLKGFDRLISRNADLFIRRGEDVYINDGRWKTLHPIRLFATMKALFEIRGKDEKDLTIRKIRKAWEDKQDKYSRMISEEVAEEWARKLVRDPITEKLERAVMFVNIEFPMLGGVESYDEIKGYIRTLMIHLNIHDEGFEERVTAHANWVAQIDAVTDPHLRLRLYRAAKGYLGEINDRAIVYEFARYVLHGGAAIFSDYASFLISVLDFAEQKIVGVLTRETFDRLIPTSEGFLIKDRARGLLQSSDPNFPTVFKFLHLALRTLGDRRYEGHGTPISKFRLEARAVGDTVKDNFDALPRTIPGAPYLDAAALLQHDHSTGRCGLIGDAATILGRLKQLGISEDLYAFVERAIERKDGVYEFMKRDPQIFQIEPDQLIALMLLPVNDWLNHPRVVRHLNSLSGEEREAALYKFNAVLDQYRERMGMIVNAVHSAQVGNLPRDIRTKMKLDPEALREGDYNMFFVAGETGRFVLNSGLLDLMG